MPPSLDWQPCLTVVLWRCSDECVVKDGLLSIIRLAPGGIAAGGPHTGPVPLVVFALGADFRLLRRVPAVAQPTMAAPFAQVAVNLEIGHGRFTIL